MGMNPRAKPNNSNGMVKSFVNGSAEDTNSNKGGSKGAKVIGSASDGSAGKLKTYKTKVANLNTGALEPLGGKLNIKNRGDL